MPLPRQRHFYIQLACYTYISRLFLKTGINKAEEGPQQSWNYPSHSNAVERQIRRQEFIDPRQLDAGRVKAIDDSKYQGTVHGTTINAAAPINEAIEQRQQDEDDNQRIDPH